VSVSPKVSFRKGDLVALTEAAFGQDWGRSREIFMGGRPITPDETDEWYRRHREDVKAGRDVWHDSAGESKLPPQSVSVQLKKDQTYVVVRGRTAPRLGYGNPTPGCCQILTETGEMCHVKRKFLRVVG
jgi:hypothetical protein